MKLFIGGAFQNKTQTAKTMTGLTEVTPADGETASLEELLEAKVICHFHSFVRRVLEGEVTGVSVQELADLLGQKNPDVVIVCNELGYGVVPADAGDRAYREAVGRVTCGLAALSSEVYRVICGIGVKIK